ncbi:MAG: 4-hydroxy-tetrahydrodipicolinate reductase [Micavibrio sp.]|nr:4-hydroxy-tetrahydrodipicolinate reductase [Micavibrio sp.]
MTPASQSKAKIGIIGAAGRMGQMIAREILGGQHTGATLAAALDHDSCPALGKDMGTLLGLEPCGVKITADKHAAFEAANVVIDFTNASATVDFASLAFQHGTAYVVGTTGLAEKEQGALKVAAQKAAVLQAANMSLGVNLLVSLIEQTAKRLGPDYDIEIFEAHHRHKVDAPSGTALALAEAAAAGRGVLLKDALIPARFGQIGARPEGSIGLSVFRGGDVIGDHTVTFAGMGERLELTHKASDRSLFARGAVTAACWLAGKPAGTYTMKDVLGL